MLEKLIQGWTQRWKLLESTLADLLHAVFTRDVVQSPSLGDLGSVRAFRRMKMFSHHPQDTLTFLGESVHPS